MPCCIYKDPMLITAQALSIVAVCFSFGGIIALVFGLVCMIVLQVVWCCRMNKCGLNTAASFATVVAIIDVIMAIVILGQGEDACSESGFDAADDDESGVAADDNYDYSTESSSCNWEVAAILMFVSAVLWTAVASLVFIFANSKRYTKWWNESDPEKRGQSATAASNSVKMAMAVPIAASVNNVKVDPADSTTEKNTTTTETIEYPDGTRKTVTTTINADETKNVTETIEQRLEVDTMSEP
ncbi:hypothetical protein ACA910_009586 [Epithemia clementina (nom. ined.)]